MPALVESRTSASIPLPSREKSHARPADEQAAHRSRDDADGQDHRPAGALSEDDLTDQSKPYHTEHTDQQTAPKRLGNRAFGLPHGDRAGDSYAEDKGCGRRQGIEDEECNSFDILDASAEISDR